MGVILLVYVICLIGIIRCFFWKDGYFSLMMIFGISSLYYYLLIPFECYLTGTNEFLTYVGGNYLTTQTVNKIGLMSVLSLFGFALGLYPVYPNFRIRSSITIKKDPVYGVLILTTIFFLIALFRREFIQAGSYTGGIETSYNSPNFAVVLQLLALSCCVLSARRILVKKTIDFIAFLQGLISVGLGVYTSSKDLILLGVLCFSVIVIKRPVYSFVKGFFIVLAPVFLIPLFVLSFSLFRAGVVPNLSKLRNTVEVVGVFKNSEPAGPYVSLNKIVSEEETDWLLGESYLSLFYFWIPRSIMPNRPLDLAEKFARSNIANWKPGQGMGFSFMAEAYWNFGVLGAFLQYTFFGLLFGLTLRMTFYLLGGLDGPAAVALVYIVSTYCLFTMHRGPFVQSFKLMTIWLPFIVVLKYLLIFTFGKSKDAKIETVND